MSDQSPLIGTLAEKSLHAGLKEWYGRKGDQFEVRVDGFVIDIVRDELLIEIQTRHLYAMKRKLANLLKNHHIHLILPIAREKWIVRQTATGGFISRRKSPKRGRLIDVFSELMRVPHLLDHPNLTIEVALTQQEEILRDDGQGSWRRKRWSIFDRCLLAVDEQKVFTSLPDYVALLPTNLQRPFTNRDLANALNCRQNLAQKITYTLRKAEAITVVKKQGNAYCYE